MTNADPTAALAQAQDLINALTAQRNTAQNDLAMAQVQIMHLTRELSEERAKQQQQPANDEQER
jgi:hypothetical protein